MADKTYRWGHPGEWLDDKIKDLCTQEDVTELASIARSLAGALDSDQLQDIFQTEMAADGYFEATAEGGE